MAFYQAQCAQLELKNVRRSFGSQVSVGASHLVVEPGSLTVLLGRSGCGKSTLLNLIAGLDQPDEGSVTYNGVTLVGAAPNTALIFQHNNLFPWMTAAENIAFALVNKGVAPELAKVQAIELLAEVGLARFSEYKPARLSGGMRQRVALARTLAIQPHLLLLDEPFSALDMQTRRMMQRYLLQIWSKTKSTVVMVTHDLHEALILADRIVLMASTPTGHIANILDINLARPRNPDQKEFHDLQQQIDDFLENETLAAEFSPAGEFT